MPRLALAATLLVPLGALLVGACNAEFCDIVECTGAQGGQGGGGGAGGSTSTSTGEGGTIDPGCIPSMLPAGAAVPATCGVFVDADANGTGTQADPLKRLDDAIALAETPDKPSVIYVCGAPELAGPFEMEGGTSIFGGLDCGAWTYDPANRPEITGLPNAPALTVREAGASFLADLEISAAPGQGDGESSIGLFIHLASVTVERSAVSASDGAQGAQGDEPMVFSSPAQSGFAQNCPNSQGANPGTNMCEGTPTNGGKGGGTANPGGVTGDSGSNNSSAMGGDGGLSGAACNAGGQGQPGDSPGPALSTSGLDEYDPGTLSSSGFTVSVAPDGIAGAPGGGGGGGRGGQISGCGGGGGGAGGCGGAGGGGGQSGGASLAIAVLDGILTLGSGVKLATGIGGAGGDGFAGANGQSGGAASTLMGTSIDGCPGGAGGTGGAGSGGAGGNGGLSALIFLQGNATSTGAPETPMVGMGGTFGAGGDGMAPNGSDGAECRLFQVGAMDPCQM